MKNILIMGVYLSEKENNIIDIMNKFSRSSDFNVTQKWAKIGKNEVDDDFKSRTVMEIQESKPKFEILNSILKKENLDEYNYIVVSDDDISFSENFIDDYLATVEKYDLALAQPARTHDSYIDHFIVEQLDGLAARKTRFVEIGPVFSIRRDLFEYILPFDEKSGMGWGLDFVWPCIVEKAGLNMGIVDACPVEHKMRAPVANYSHKQVDDEMNEYLKTKKHLLRSEAFRILESYV